MGVLLAHFMLTPEWARMGLGVSLMLESPCRAYGACVSCFPFPTPYGVGYLMPRLWHWFACNARLPWIERIIVRSKVFAVLVESAGGA